MTTTEVTTEILYDLIAINNDRIKGYEKASSELTPEDSDLQPVFGRMISESRTLKTELEHELHQSGGFDPDVDTNETTFGGKIYRTWMDVKATFSGNSRKAVLDSCEYGEDAAQDAYKEALEDFEISGTARALISDQKTKLRRSHDEIKALRDASNRD